MPGTPAERFVHNLLAVAGNFYVAGDEAVRHNLPGRPVNDLLLAALFTLGLAAAFWHIRRPAMRLLLLWLAVMATPTLFAAQAPHVLRGIGMLPPLALLYGIGGGVILGALARWQRWAAPALVILVLAGLRRHHLSRLFHALAAEPPLRRRVQHRRATGGRRHRRGVG
jgi:hypothetical protein